MIPKRPYMVPSMEHIRALPWNGLKSASFFGGCGGSSLGFKMANWKVIYANEFIPEARKSYKANHPATILDGRDIRQVTANDFFERTGLDEGELDHMDGSPPCKNFSMAGARDMSGKVERYSDTKQRSDDLFDEFIRMLIGIKPKTFDAENVVGLTMGNAKSYLGVGQVDLFEGSNFADKDGNEIRIRSESETILGQFRDAGYSVRYEILNAVNYGVPQARKRVIFFGVRNDLMRQYGTFKFPGAQKTTYTLQDALDWPLRRVVECEEDAFMDRYAVGKEWHCLDVGKQSEKYFQLIRANPDKPCPTILASHGDASKAGVSHPYFCRRFSIKELKRICSFPDDFILTGTYRQQYERLGRAVPPLMMRAIARQIAKYHQQ